MHVLRFGLKSGSGRTNLWENLTNFEKTRNGAGTFRY